MVTPSDDQLRSVERVGLSVVPCTVRLCMVILFDMPMTKFRRGFHGVSPSSPGPSFVTRSR